MLNDNREITYDAAGNLIGDGTATYTYDPLNHMIIRNATPFTYSRIS